jgi:anti-anti-sigma factor
MNSSPNLQGLLIGLPYSVALWKGHAVFTVMVFAGECDVGCESELHRELESSERKPEVIFDLSQVEFMDARCVGQLVAFQNRRRSADLKPADFIVRSGAPIERLFEIVSMEREFNIAQSLDELVEKKGSTIEVRYVFCRSGELPPAPLRARSA